MLDSEFEKNVAALDPKKPIIVHCAAGSRSSRAIREVFSKSGIQTIYHLSSGIGFPAGVIDRVREWNWNSNP